MAELVAAGVEPGCLLVASPILGDPNFHRTVIYVIEHGPQGTTGLVLNRPSQAAVSEILPQWWELASPPKNLFVGGPVERTAALCLGRTAPIGGISRSDAEPVPVGWRPVSGSVGLIDLDGEPERMAAMVTDLRIFAGYAGWSADQLATEIADNAWIIVAGRADDVFSDGDGDLWAGVLRRQGGHLALIAGYPDDPRLN
ncbi:MAG: YqgE/AlgH family protein [Mycobacteriales bacterium]